MRKLERILNVIQDEDWSFGKFLYHFFRTKDEDGVEIKGRTKKHAGMLSIFMHGSTKYHTACILKEWIRNPIGIPDSSHDEYSDMFSVTKLFESIHHARPALTSFAAQLVKEHLLLTAKSIVSPNGGLHREQADQNEEVPILEGDVVAVSEKSTLEKTQSVIEKKLSLMWHYCLAVATPNRKNRLSRAKNPPEDGRALTSNHRHLEIVSSSPLQIL
ncbi:hypothetical protein GGU11DRAFT_750189 [Lentinula aff. detonsa]|nr:hypothetical protein GGU11DRAFT_750189 [Lentinula aff. detonsa]